MKKEYKERTKKLRATLQSENFKEIRDYLDTILSENETEWEEEILSGVEYKNGIENKGYDYWNLFPNEIFSQPQDENSFPTFNFFIYALLVLVGSSSSKKAKQLRDQVHSLNLFGFNLPEVPPEIGNYKNIKELIVNNCMPQDYTFEGSEIPIQVLPKEIGDLEKLEHLDLGQNTGLIPPDEIAKLKKLKTIIMTSNQASHFPECITKVKSLQVLKMESCRFGTLPKSIGNLKKLKELILLSCNIDELPIEIGELKNLEILDLSCNQLESLPEEFASLKNLKQFSFYENKFRTFPDVLRELKSLENLDDLENSFFPFLEGDIPLQVQNLFLKELEENNIENVHLLNLGSMGYPLSISAAKDRIVCISSKYISLWDANRLELIWSEEMEGGQEICISSDASFFVCLLGGETKIRRYNISNEQVEFVWQKKIGSYCSDLIISPDTKKVGISLQNYAGEIRVFNSLNGHILHKLTLPKDLEYDGYGFIGLSFSNDGKFLSGADSDWSTVIIWDLEKVEMNVFMEIEGAQLFSTAQSCNGKYLLAGTVEVQGYVWNRETKEEVMEFSDSSEVGRYVATHPTKENLFASGTFGVAHIWDIETKSQLAEFRLPENHLGVKEISYSEENFLCLLVQYQGYISQKEGSHFALVCKIV